MNPFAIYKKRSVHSRVAFILLSYDSPSPHVRKELEERLLESPSPSGTDSIFIRRS